MMENETATPVLSHMAATEPWKKGILTLSLSLIIIITLIGNIIVVVVFCTYKPLRKIGNSFLVSLAISDLLIGAVDIPTWIVSAFFDVSGNKIVSTKLFHA